MGYQQYGISPQLVERIKLKMKNPTTKERVKDLIDGVTKQDLQSGPKVQKLVKTTAILVKEKLTPAEEEQIVRFIISQRIDPNNTFHLIKLWSMFR